MKRTAIFLVLAAQCALAQTYGRMDFSLQNAQGQAVAGATVQVYSQSACGAAAGALATLYPAATGGTPLTQPLITNGFGASFAYALQGCYTVVYQSPSTGSQTFKDQNAIAASAVGGSGTVSDGAGTTTPGMLAQSTNTAHVIGYVPSFAMSLCSAPSVATCDGATDDHLAVQAMLDSYQTVFIPTQPDGSATQINLGTSGVVLCNSSQSYNAIYGNGQFFAYSGSGVAITDQCDGPALLRDFNVDATGSTGATVISMFGHASIVNITDFGLDSTGISIWSVGGVLSTISGYTGSGALIPVGGNLTSVTASLFDRLDALSLSADAKQLSLNAVEFTNGAATSHLSVSGGVAEATVFTDVYFTGPLVVSSSSTKVPTLIFNGVTLSSLSFPVSSSDLPIMNGTVLFLASGTPAITGNFLGTLNASDADSAVYAYTNGIQTNLNYSAAGTPLPACSSALNRTTLVVSDATLPTFLGTYTSGGAVVAPVMCNGSDWVTY